MFHNENLRKFCLERLVVCDFDKFVFGVDFDDVDISSKYSFVSELSCNFKGDFKNIFLEEYGCFSDEEKVASRVNEVFYKLYKGCFCEGLKSEINSCLEVVYNGEFLKDCKCLVEWC